VRVIGEVVLWFAGLLGLVVATLFASARGRAAPTDVVARSIIAIAAVAYVGIVVAAVWAWGGATATTGRASQLQGGALVHLAIDGVRVAMPAAPIALGHDHAAAIRVPGDGGELARIAPATGGVSVQGARLAVVHAAVPPDAITAAATARGCAATDATYTLPPGAAVIAIDCDGDRPTRAFVVRNTRAGELMIAPLAWRGRFVAEQLTVRVGDALRIGGGDDVIAGLTTWSVASPNGAAAMLAVPADPTACAGWLPGAGALAPPMSPAWIAAVLGHGSGPRARGDGACVVDTGAFVIAAVPLVPDADAVIDRGLAAALAIGGPPLALLLVLALSARRDRRTRGLSRALRLCLVGAALTALCSWRLLWAYRIDMLRELASHGVRLVDNQLAIAAIGGALAGNAALAHDAIAEASPARRLFAAVLAWGAWLVVAGAVVFGAGGPPALTAPRVAMLGFSLIAATLPVTSGLAARATQRLVPEVALGAIAFGAVAGKLAAPRSALIKLALAYAFVLAAHAALRRLLVRDTAWIGRATSVILLAAAALALARYDAGVTTAIAGLGLALAMLVAGHDAAYDASQAARIGVLEREHARLLAVHGAAGIGLAIGLAIAALGADDHQMIVDGAAFVVNAPLVVAGLFAIAAILARSHRRGWAPWLCAALAALAVWGAREAIVTRATGGETVGARRVAAVLDPGYAVLRDEHAFVANASAWREAALPRTGATAAADRWTGEGYFGARVRDLGVSRSIDNDYLPVLVARETGIGGLVQTIGLLLVLAVGGGAVASLRLRHASREHRARWLVTAVVAGLAVYQPLASLGVLPLTGISWPGLGIDSPADIWLFVLGAVWCFLCAGDDAPDDERVRGTPRLRRARAIVLAALGVAAVTGVIVVARAGATALGRVASEDDRLDAALRYASTIACPWPSHTGPTLADVVPLEVGGAPTDDATARFDRELKAAWTRERLPVIAAIPACRDRIGRWSLARDGEACVATLRAGIPSIALRIDHADGALHGACKVSLSEDLIAGVRAPARANRAPRIRVVSEAMGVAATDLGELVAGARVVRLRAGTPAAELAKLAPGVTAASRLTITGDVVLDLRPNPRGVLLHGDAELFVSEPIGGTGPASQLQAWHRMAHGADVLLDRMTLIAAGPPAERRVAVFRPPREWPGSPPVVDPLLADDTSAVGDRARRSYPYASALPELGWVNPYDVDRSLGLDGWIHAALHAAPAPVKASCGTLAPPAIARDRVCSPNPLDGVLECRVALQPELAAHLHAIAEQVVASPKLHTGRDVTPVRVAYVTLRGDTGEVLAQGSVAPGRGPLAYAPADAAAEAALIQLREARGEADAERVDWNQPIAVGSTFKPILARAAEQAFPQPLAQLTLTASGHAAGCKAHHGVAVDPLLGHCPPSTLADDPPTADLHDYLARSLNWYQAALGVLGLGLPSATLSVNGTAVAFTDVAASDLTAWPTTASLEISDQAGPILTGHAIAIDGLRRTPMWSRVEALLGRPLCTLGDRGACEAAADRADVCAARGLPIANPGRDLRYLVALGPDRVDLYGDDRAHQSRVPIREYFQLLRGSGVHSIGSLLQLTDAFNRVVYDPSPGAAKLAASWFPAPAVGVTPTWSCTGATGHANTVLGTDGGLCAVVQGAGTAHALIGDLLADRRLVIYAAKTGTIDSLADIARRPAACQAWNDHHVKAAQLACGKTTPDDSLFVISFGVVTAHGTVPITLGVQLQRGSKGSAAHATPEFVHAIVDYLR
jgi:hypothetical protein